MRLLKNLLYRLPQKHSFSAEDIAGLRTSQDLAYSCAKDISREMKEGWTEIQVSRLMEVYLRDCGVRTFFHKPFAWFGARTRFDGMKKWRDFLPTDRRLQPADCVILDAAPVFKGYTADIGYSCSLQRNSNLERGREVLRQLRSLVLDLFKHGLSGGEICESVTAHIRHSGYDPVHHRYPGGVLGHRIHRMKEGWRPPLGIPFGWEAVTGLLFRGVYPDLLNEEHQGRLHGAWAIEPHLGGRGFGLKFEEVLVVDDQGVRWLSEDIPW